MTAKIREAVSVVELERLLLAAGCLECDLHETTLAWFQRNELQRHERDCELIKRDLRYLREWGGKGRVSAGAMREFLLTELLRHEQAKVKLREQIEQAGFMALTTLMRVPPFYVVPMHEDAPAKEGSKEESHEG